MKLPLPPHNTGLQPKEPSTVSFLLVLNGQKCTLPGQANPKKLDASSTAAMLKQGSKASPFSALGSS